MLLSALTETNGTSITELEHDLREKGLYELVVNQLNIKSKKKRVRKKALKKAIALVNVIEIPEEKPEAVSSTANPHLLKLKEIQLDKMPVTLLLKLGKQYLRDESIVKHYYNANEVEFYKNKQMLVNMFDSKIPMLSSLEQEEIVSILFEQQKKKAKD